MSSEIEQKNTDPQINDCCKNTIELHSAHNQMIVCDKCNELIKLFANEVAYRNYIKYCKSKGRETITGKHFDFNVVIVKRNT